jgi:hypothetical protein
MTREDRWIVSLDEIRALRWECVACHVAIAFALDQTIRLPLTCPGCGADGIVSGSPDDRAAADFVRALKAVLQAKTRLRLEFLGEPHA